MAAGRVGCRAARDDRGDGAGHEAQTSVRRAGPSQGWAQDPPPTRRCAPVMRRLLVLPLLLAGLVLAPAAAQAATPGVNIVGSADVAAAAATGAKTVRVFAVRSSFPAAYPDFKNIVTTARASGMGVVFVLVGSRDGASHRPGRLRELRRGVRHPDEERGRRRRLRGLERGGRDRVLGRSAPTPAQYAAILKAAYPADQERRPEAKVLLGPLTGNNYNFLGRDLRHGRRQLLRRRRGPHRHGVPGRSARASSTGRWQRRALHLPRLPLCPRRHGRQRRRRQADLDDRAGLDDHDHRPARAACGRARRPPASARPRRPPTSSEAYHCLAGYPYIEAGMWFTLKDSHRQRRRARPLRSATPRQLAQARLGRVPERRHAVATSSPGRAATSTRPSLTISAPGTSEQYMQTLTISAVATDATQRRAHDLPGRRQGDPQLHRHRRRPPARPSRSTGRARRACPSAPHDLRHRARPAGQHEHEVRAGHPGQDAPGDAEDAHQAGQGQDRQGPQGIDLRPRAQDRERRACRARSASTGSRSARASGRPSTAA